MKFIAVSTQNGTAWIRASSVIAVIPLKRAVDTDPSTSVVFGDGDNFVYSPAPVGEVVRNLSEAEETRFSDA